MCGIAGYLGARSISDTVVTQTLALMKRRGPDAQEYQHIQIGDRKKCTLLHSRLSIIDLGSSAGQPFHYKDKTLIYNGEIYNYLEVKKQLVALGHIFKTRSDTEVLIHALDEWGADALNIIEGMWAFALYDQKERKLMLSRDPFGEKPLYLYTPRTGELYFASEVKYLAQLAQTRFTPNHNHISRFLVNGYKSLYKSTETFFQEITELPKSTYMEVVAPDFKTKQHRYWIPKFEENTSLDFNDAVSITRQSLIQSVEMRLRSDVPIAFHISGGIDSNTLVSIAKRVFNYEVHGFHIKNRDNRYEEKKLVDLSVKALGIEYSELLVDSKNFIPNLASLVAYHDAPVFTISFYLSWLLQRSISKSGYRIAISGVAADELFSGYFDHHLMYLHDIHGDDTLFEHSVASWQREIAPIVRNRYLQSPDYFIRDPFSRDHIYLNNDIYASYLNKNWQEPFQESYYRPGLLRNRMLNEIFQETTPIALHEEDLNAMYFSVENRSPFLDRSLFESAHLIPTQHLIQDGKSKAVLREAMRGIVEDSILDNPRKVGFNAPITDLCDFSEPETQKWFLKDSPIFDLVDKKSMKNFMGKKKYLNSDSKFLFSFLSSKLFLEKFS